MLTGLVVRGCFNSATLRVVIMPTSAALGGLHSVTVRSAILRSDAAGRCACVLLATVVMTTDGCLVVCDCFNCLTLCIVGITTDGCTALRRCAAAAGEYSLGNTGRLPIAPTAIMRYHTQTTHLHDHYMTDR